MNIVVGITGASGSLYAVSLLNELLALGPDQVSIHAVMSRTGEEVMRFETDCGRSDFPGVRWHEPERMFSSLASGSHAADAMVVVPCSMHTLSCIAHGLTHNVLQRIATVILKEKKPLVLVPRETPLSAVHLENMLKLSHAGAILLPASPAFYFKPQRIEELSRFMTARILNLLNIPHTIAAHWNDPSE